MTLRRLLLMSGLIAALAAESFASTRLPGFRPSDLGLLVIDPSDLRTLNAAVTIDADAIKQAHAAMKQYQQAVQEGSRNVLASMDAMEPPGAAAAFQHEQQREKMVERVREQIEVRRSNGEFQGNPAALREAWQEAMDEAQRDIDRAHRDTANVPGWSDAFQRQAAALAEWYETKDGLSAALQQELLAIVTTEQSPEVTQWWLHARLGSAMSRGRLSGEVHHPFESDFQRTDASDLALQSWAQRHIELIDARDDAIRRVPLVAADAIERSHLNLYRDAVYDAMAYREAVRDHANEGVDLITVLLDDVAARAFVELSRKKAYPGIWKSDRAMRAVTAALQASTLDAAQKGQLGALRIEHRQLSDDLCTRHLDAVWEEEGRRLADQEVQRVVVFFGDAEFVVRPTPMLDGSVSERRTLSDDTMERLRGILTDEQWQLIPGTRTAPERD